MARAWYLRVVEPTTQTSTAGSDVSSRYIEYCDDPGAVVNSQGSWAVPVPVISLLGLMSVVLVNRAKPLGLASILLGGDSSILRRKRRARGAS